MSYSTAEPTSRKKICSRVLAEFFLAVRFGLVGILATTIHITVVWTLLSRTLLPVLVANTIAFASAFGVSFAGNYLWTFGSPGSPRKVIVRFLTISAGAFFLNSVLLGTILKMDKFNPILAAIGSATIIPIITFLASRFWGFKYKDSPLEPKRPVQNEIKSNRMNKFNYRHSDWPLVAAFSIVAGIFSFLMLVGPRALYPRNIAWLGQGDSATHYLGWLFFRNSEWSFPIGLNPTYGLELSNAILFSDSNPLLAILFKPFSQFLPDTFQYFGIWLLACFILQAFFSYKLINLVTKSFLLSALGACFFVFSPIMIFRLNVHLNLVGHFLVVASLYLALAPLSKQRIIAWAALLMVSALTHAYLLGMVGLIWAADIVGRLISRALSYSPAARELSFVLGVTFFACWQAGYFSVGDGTVAGGYGLYRMNLLSIFDPSGWSYVLSDIPEGGGDHEGFNYLGLGMIFLGICALPSLFYRHTEVVRSIIKRPILLISLLGLTIYALSNKLGIASANFELVLPNDVLRIANLFRASGRMFWPVFYMIFFTTIFLIVRGYSRRVAITLLGLALLIQIADTSKMWLVIRTKLMTTPSSIWQTKMVDHFWNEAAKKYQKVRLLPPGDSAKNWQTVASYAGSHKIATDAVYLARISKAPLEKSLQKSASAIAHGTFENDSLYIVDESQLRLVAMNVDMQSDLLVQIDGFNVLAPGWKKCATCSTVVGEVKISDYLPERLRLGKRLLFSQNQSGSRYLSSGWSAQEDWGIWTDGADSAIILPLDSQQATTILVEANPLLSPSHLKQTLEVKINGISTNSITLTAESEGRFEIEIPEQIRKQLKYSPLLKLQFHFPDAARPVDIGINNDGRKLSIRLNALTVQ